MEAGLLVAALSGIVTRIPWITVAIVGIVVAAVRRERHPRVSLLVIIALIVDLVLMLVSSFTAALVPIMMMQDGGSTANIGIAMAGISLCSSAFSAFALALLLWAALGWRHTPTESV